MLAGYALWGFGATFISGAFYAWVTDEAGKDHVARLLLRGERFGWGFAIVGVAGGVGLASIDLQVPIVVGGCVMVALAGYLALAMPETPFRAEGEATRGPPSSSNIHLLATHYRIMSRDGNYEFETDAGAVHLNAYNIGTPNRIPVQIGSGDGQDVTSLLVGGKNGQSKDITRWLPGTPGATSIDGRGPLGRPCRSALRAKPARLRPVFEAMGPRSRESSPSATGALFV